MDLQKIKTYAEGILAEIATGTTPQPLPEPVPEPVPTPTPEPTFLHLTPKLLKRTATTSALTRWMPMWVKDVLVLCMHGV